MLEDPLLKPREVASLLGCHLDTVYDLIRSCELPTVAVGKRRRVKREDLEAYLRRDRRERQSA